MMDKWIQKLNAMRSVTTHSVLLKAGLKLRIILIVIVNRLLPLWGLPIGGYLVQDFDFIISGLQIMLCALLDFHCNITIVFEIFCEPDGRKMTPTEFLNYYVSIEKDFSNMNGMIASDFIIRHALILTRILVFEEALTNFVFQRSEILFRFILGYCTAGRNIRLLIVVVEIVVSMMCLIPLLLILLFVLLALFLFVSSSTRASRSIDFIIILVGILVACAVNLSITVDKVLISAARNSTCWLLRKLRSLSGVERRLGRRMKERIWTCFSISEGILL